MAFSAARAAPSDAVRTPATQPRPGKVALRAGEASLLAERLATRVRVDVLLAISFVVLAAVVRWPNLLMVPELTTGGAGIMMALDIADGRAFYLREISPYIGAPYIWLLALVYKLFGPSIEATLLVTWAIGALTILPTYLLGREIGGRAVGSIAALLLATSPAHTVITSHVPLSHSVTPLVSTTALWLLARAVRHASTDIARGGKLLAAAGLISGLALQTHPTVAPLLAGAAIGAVLMRRQWLRTRWPAIAVACAILGYSTLLVYHVTSGFEIVNDIRNKEASYRDAGHDDGGSLTTVYPGNLGQLLLSSARLIGGAVEDREDAAEYLSDPWVWVPTALALIGLVVAVRARAGWLVGALLLAIVLPPAFNGKYRPLLDGRFLMPSLPVWFAMLGLTVVGAVRLVARSGSVAREAPSRGPRLTPDDAPTGLRLAPEASWPGLRLARTAAATVLVVGTTVLVAQPLNALDELYESSLDDGYSNVEYLSTLRLIEAARRGNEAVLLDPMLFEVKTAGGGKALTNFTWLLAVSRIPSDAPASLPASAQLTGRLAILHRTTANRLDDTVSLDALDGKRINKNYNPSFRLYRIGNDTAQRP
jgi:4-amino-4-deoxy-L-arabinose transferase-like glycosyltransferase